MGENVVQKITKHYMGSIVLLLSEHPFSLSKGQTSTEIEIYQFRIQQII